MNKNCLSRIITLIGCLHLFHKLTKVFEKCYVINIKSNWINMHISINWASCEYNTIVCISIQRSINKNIVWQYSILTCIQSHITNFERWLLCLKKSILTTLIDRFYQSRHVFDPIVSLKDHFIAQFSFLFMSSRTILVN